MAKFTPSELRNLLHSDNQLWAKSSKGPVTPELCEELGLPEGTTGIVKEIDCPELLGENRYWVFPEDNKDFFESFGPTVRNLIKDIQVERDEAAARKRAQAERDAQEASEKAGGSAESTGPEGGVPAVAGDVQVSSQEAVPPHAQFEAGPETFSGRRDALARGVSELETYIAEATTRMKRYRKELRAIEAALEIMNASEDDGAEPTDVPTETTREGPGDSVG